MLTATVSGSFHRHMHAIYLAVAELTDLGVQVLSPADPRVVDQVGDFLFVASDFTRSVRLVQDRHLESIRGSSFLWLVAPDGYVGQSASMELGFAVANDLPIFSTTIPFDLTLRQYVHKVPNMQSAVDAAGSMARSQRRFKSFLIDPHASIDAAHSTLEAIRRSLSRNPRQIGDDAAREVYLQLDELPRLPSGPARSRR